MTNKEEAKTFLKKFIKKGNKLSIFITSVSRSGMSRQMKVYTRDTNITWHVNNLLEYSNKNNYIKVGGCGMDMAFWLAITITNILYPKPTKKQSELLTGNGGDCLPWISIY